jgi:hypothetical protein
MGASAFEESELTHCSHTIGGPGVLIGVDEAQVGVVQSPILGNRIFANAGLGIDLAPP